MAEIAKGLLLLQTMDQWQRLTMGLLLLQTMDQWQMAARYHGQVDSGFAATTDHGPVVEVDCGSAATTAMDRW